MSQISTRWGTYIEELDLSSMYSGRFAVPDIVLGLPAASRRMRAKFIGFFKESVEARGGS
jgi:hypothetical protein